jgi:hypothetical protein
VILQKGLIETLLALQSGRGIIYDLTETKSIFGIQQFPTTIIPES